MHSALVWTWLLVASVYGLHWWLTRNFNYWRKRGIDGPKPIIGFGTILYKMFTPMPTLELEWHQKFGNIYGLFLGNEPMLTVAEPELIKDILIKDFNNFIDRRHLATYHEIVNLNLFFVLGQQWKRIRSIVTPSFTNNKIKSMNHLMEKCVRNTVRFIGNTCEDTPEMDMKRVLGNLTMDVIASTAFATKIDSNIESSNPFLRNATEFFNLKAHRYFAAFLLPKWILKHVLKSQFDETTNQFFIGISRQIIKTRREQNIRHNDLIQLLMDAEMESKCETKGNNSEAGKKLTENEILAQCWVIFLAGYETTSSTISFCIYEMALNPIMQKKLFEEVWHGTQQGSDFSFERLNKLPYLEAVIFETLRKYPPLIRVERTSASDYKLANTDITLKAGMVVEIPIYAIHHSEQFYKNPEQFLPDRFLPENKYQLKPYTFFPFGLGPRNCIGMKFALMEIKLALSMIICSFKFSPSERTQIPMKFNTITPFLATNFNYLKVEKRK